MTFLLQWVVFGARHRGTDAINALRGNGFQPWARGFSGADFVSARFNAAMQILIFFNTPKVVSETATVTCDRLEPP